MEQVAAVFARVSVHDDSTDAQRAEFREIVRKVSRAFPSWQSELFPSQQAIDRVTAKVGLPGDDFKVAAIGPLLQDAFFTVGAKLAFALHYKHTDKILPHSGAVVVAFETNVPRSKEMPADWFDGFGPPQMLKQGEWTSDGHFAYRAEWNPDGSVSRFVCHLGGRWHSSCSSRRPAMSAGNVKADAALPARRVAACGRDCTGAPYHAPARLSHKRNSERNPRLAKPTARQSPDALD